MKRRNIEMIVEKALASDNSMDVLESAFGEAPIHVREKVVDAALELYNYSIEMNYFSRVSDLEEKRLAQREYAFRTAVTYGYMQMGWKRNGEQ